MNIEQQRDLLAAALDRAMGMIRAYNTRPAPHCNWVIQLCESALDSMDPQHLFKLREATRIREETDLRFVMTFIYAKELNR